MRRAAQRHSGRGPRPSAAAATTTATASIRNVLAGLAAGVCVGSIGTLLWTTAEPQDAKRVPAPPQQPSSGASTRRSDVPVHEALRYGYPSLSNVHVRSGYVVSYDYRTRNAAWVLEFLNKDTLDVIDDTDRSKSNFAVDKLTPEPFRVHPNQFAKTGYDKGHLAPARDMTTSQKAMNESFLMTNISPQVGVGFNRGYWSRLEGFIRHLAFQFDGLYVVTGPLFLPKKHKRSGEYEVRYPVIGTPPDAIAVPTHFFKVVLARRQDGTFLTAGFILPNQVIPDNKNLLDFLTPLHVIEKYSGLLFFDQLDNVTKLELCTATKCSLAGAYKRSVTDK